MPDRVTVTVRHAVDGGLRHRTRMSFPFPENIDPGNEAEFITAMIYRAAAEHTAEHFDALDPLLVSAFRLQVITGLLDRALEGPHRRLAARILRVLRLTDRQLLEQYANRTVGENVG